MNIIEEGSIMDGEEVTHEDLLSEHQKKILNYMDQLRLSFLANTQYKKSPNSLNDELKHLNKVFESLDKLTKFINDFKSELNQASIDTYEYIRFLEKKK